MITPTHVLVIADGDVDESLLGTLAAEAGVALVAADGGAGRVLRAGLVPDVVVGDFDSLSGDDRARLEELGAELRVASPDKDQSDTELCLLTALELGASRVTVLGAFGLVRPEHSVANLMLLADPRFDGLDLALAGRGSRVVRRGTVDGPARIELEGEPGDFVSLFPLGEVVEGVVTDGLRFPLTDEALPLGSSRGLSNELLAGRARVTARRGRLLVIHTRRSMADAPATGGA